MPRSDRPNILWVSFEDTNPFYGCYGDPVARTPNLDRLAAQGSRWTNAFSTAGVCAPARARHVAWIGDGAEWLWALKDEHLPHAVEILDFEHAKENLESVGKAMWGETGARTRKWIHHREGRLIRGGVRSVLSELKRMSRAAGAPPPSCPPEDRRRVLADNVRYFEHNAHRMSYDRYRQKGYPIGSGVVESACGHVIAQRMKITPRMSWNRAQADAVLHLRCLVKSKQWDRFWGLSRLVA